MRRSARALVTADGRRSRSRPRRVRSRLADARADEPRLLLRRLLDRRRRRARRRWRRSRSLRRSSRGSITASVVELVAGGALLFAGLLTWTNAATRRFGGLLLAAAAGWLLLEWNNPGAGSALVF